MRARIDAIAAALDRGELKATSPLYKELMQAWTDYGLRRIRDAVRAATSDYCRLEGEDLRRGLAMTKPICSLCGAMLRCRSGKPRWTGSGCRHLRSRRKTACPGTFAGRWQFRAGEPPGSPLLGLQTDARRSAERVHREPGGRADRHRGSAGGGGSVRRAGGGGAVRALAAGQRSLRLRLLTPPSDWYVGRPIEIQVEGWRGIGARVCRIRTRLGDHTPPETKSAEDALKQPFVHTYTTPLTARTRVVAASGFRDGTLEVTGDQDSGTLTFNIGVSPVSVARRLADAFLSIRFGLALLIALLVYFWQFWTNQKTFGSQSLDYVKAFVLGVVAEAAVRTCRKRWGS